MNALAAMTKTETKLFLREPMIWGAAVILPTAVLVILGAIFGNSPEPELGGYGFLTLFTPSLVVITLATLTVNTFTSRMGTYREQGVLRRLSTTPVRPATLLAAQLAINIVTAFIAVAILIGVAYVAFGVPLPQAPLAFAVALGVGAAALFGLALLIAAVVPTAAAANAVDHATGIQCADCRSPWTPFSPVPTSATPGDRRLRAAASGVASAGQWPDQPTGQAGSRRIPTSSRWSRRSAGSA